MIALNSQLKSVFFMFKVKTKIEDTCKGEFDQTFSASLVEWLNNVVFDWMKRILPPKGTGMHIEHYGKICLI